jgi:hypothetical protein
MLTVRLGQHVQGHKSNVGRGEEEEGMRSYSSLLTLDGLQPPSQHIRGGGAR